MKRSHPSIFAIVIAAVLLTVASAANAAAQTVGVSNIEELYAAVNDPANAGTTIVLAPGVYTLST